MLDVIGAKDGDGELGLAGTPARVARMMVNELYSSYQPGALEDLRRQMTTFPATKGRSYPMLVEGPIPFASTCAHHMLPFFGEAFVGYIPSGCLVGLSKLARVVDFFSRKLQMQERMTDEIADFLQETLKPRAVIVLTAARHLCMEVRGVKKPGVVTRMSAIRGKAVREAGVREEFYALIGTPRG